jgi:hypothetical protein
MEEDEDVICIPVKKWQEIVDLIAEIRRVASGSLKN